MLNENLELDINKITVDDFVTSEYLPSFEINGPVDTNPPASPNAVEFPEIEGGGYDGYCTLPSWANGAIVSSTYKYSDGSNLAQVVFYLNNSDLTVLKNYLYSMDDIALGYVVDEFVSAVLGFIPTPITQIITYLQLFQQIVETIFVGQITDMCLSGKKGKVTISGSYRSIVEWTDNKFYARNGSLNGSVFRSVVNFLS